MNDSAEHLLASLKEEHRQLDSEIQDLRARGVTDQLELARLKKRKLHLKDRIQMMHDQSVPDIIA